MFPLCDHIHPIFLIVSNLWQHESALHLYSFVILMVFCERNRRVFGLCLFPPGTLPFTFIQVVACINNLFLLLMSSKVWIFHNLLEHLGRGWIFSFLTLSGGITILLLLLTPRGLGVDGASLVLGGGACLVFLLSFL